jgi:predicted enzyme related to lactoylglutathione lyase
MTKRNIVHIEISTRNAEETRKFYQKLFGWKITPIPEMNYTTWEADEGPGGGFSPVGEDTKSGDILIHVNSDDIEADLKKAVKLGATVVREKQEIPNIGWWGVFKDPTGNRIALYTDMHPTQRNK